MRAVDMYEVLVIEDGIWYIRYYPEGLEDKGIDMRLSDEQMKYFCIDKVEV